MDEKKIQDIEKEMTSLYPEKELAYMDYLDNTGDNSGFRERLWDEYETLRDRWNKLVLERRTILKKQPCWICGGICHHVPYCSAGH